MKPNNVSVYFLHADFFKIGSQMVLNESKTHQAPMQAFILTS